MTLENLYKAQKKDFYKDFYKNKSDCNSEYNYDQQNKNCQDCKYANQNQDDLLQKKDDFLKGYNK